MDILDLLKSCTLCPRECRAYRLNGGLGYCRAGDSLKVSKAMLHMWEEPCISGDNGSGAVFFSHCHMGCVFCQNHDISSKGFGREISIERLSEIFLNLQYKGAHNINLVSPTHYVPQIIKAIDRSKDMGLSIPIVYNSNGYEKTDTLKLLEGYVDVYLPDIKYFSPRLSLKYSNAGDYFRFASEAVSEMYRQVGGAVFEDGLIKRGVIIRHLLLPGMLSDSRKILDWISENLPRDVYISLMSQYVPMYRAFEFPEIDKKVSRKSYDWLVDYALSIGLENGFIQDFDSANEAYTPQFDLSGVQD